MLAGSRIAATAAVVVAVALSGCGDGTDAVDAGAPEPEAPGAHLPVAVEADGLLPPGTALGGGVAVQEGSRLVGTVFPSLHGRADARDWTALLVVDGDPVEVWDRYASALGVDDRADAPQSCVVMDVDAPPADPTGQGGLAEYEEAPPTRFLTEARIDGEDRLRCEASLRDVRITMAVGAARSPRWRCDADASAGAPATGCGRAAEAHLLLQVFPSSADDTYERLGTYELRFQRTWAARVASGEPQALPPEDELIPVPEGPIVAPDLEPDGLDSRLPVAGQPVDGGLDIYLGDRWVVPEGGRSLVAPAMLLDCNSGLVAVLELEGAPATAARAFDDADPRDQDLQVTEGVDDDGLRWARGGAVDAAGGHALVTNAVDASDGRSFVLVTECGD